MIKLYGSSMSRSARCLWALEELGVKYDHSPVAFDGGTRTPEFLKINPNGHIPALDDNGVVLWESMAINLYLAEKYGKTPLWPATVEGRAAAYQWSFWGMCEVEPHLITLLMHRMFLPADQRNPKAIDTAVEALKAPFKVIDQQLSNKEYLGGRDFTITDLNAASILGLSQMVGVDLAPNPNLSKWLQKCMGREANERARNMK